LLENQSADHARLVMVSEVARATYEDVSFEVHDGRRLPVVVAFKGDSLVIQTIAKQELLPFDGISCELVAVYNVTDVHDDVLSRLRGPGKYSRMTRYMG
jgi:hypothetical protein